MVKVPDGYTNYSAAWCIGECQDARNVGTT